MTSQELRSAPLGALALVVSAVTLLFAVWAWRTHESQVPMAPPLDAAVRERLAQLSDTVDKLELELQRLAAPALASAPAQERQPMAAGGDVDQRLAGLDARIAKLDASLAELQRAELARRAAPGAADARSPAPPSAEVRERIADSRRRALDAAQPEDERLKALRELRGLGEGARSGPVATAMADLAQASRDPKVRADVWRQMHGAKDPVLVQPLLAALAQDVDESVREKAAECLDDFLERPEVRQALEQASQSDGSAKVRRRAEDSLHRKR